MLYVMIILWGIAFFLLLANFQRTASRWLSGVAFSGGAGALAATIDQVYRPAVEHWLYDAMALSSLTSYYGLPYTFFMFAMYYNEEFVSIRWKRILPWVLLVPIVLTIVFTPGYTRMYPVTYPVVALWALPYIFFGTYLVLTRRETTRQMQINHYFTSLAVLPAILFATTMNYILSSLGLLGLWRYNVWIIIISAVIFVYALFKYGFMGIQFYIERRRLDYTFRAITSGTAILNHSIKNDVGKIKLFSEKMKSYADETGQEELTDDIQVIQKSTKHIEEMIQRVHHQTQDFVVKSEVTNVGKLLDEVIVSLKPLLRHIEMVREYDQRYDLWCDRTQISETLHNIILNAAEATHHAGTITIQCEKTKRNLIIRILDQGSGISKQELQKVTEPFYTTKSSSKYNFGLGLAYCNNVMMKHNGSLKIDSVLGKGTTVELYFPRKRLIQHGKRGHI